MVIYAIFSCLWTCDQMRWSDVKKFFFQIWTYYIPIERKFYAEQKFQKDPYPEMKWKPGISHRTSKKTGLTSNIWSFFEVHRAKAVPNFKGLKKLFLNFSRGVSLIFFVKLYIFAESGLKSRFTWFDHGSPRISPYY